MQSTGQTDTHEMSSTSMQGSAMTYAMVGGSPATGRAAGRGIGGTRSGSLSPRSGPGRPRRWTGGRRERTAVGADAADGDHHPLREVAGDVAADEPGARSSVGGDGPDGVDPLPGPDHDPHSVERRGRRDEGRGSRGMIGDGGLGRFPRDLRLPVADDRLVDLEATVDDVEQDRLARNKVDRLGDGGGLV